MGIKKMSQDEWISIDQGYLERINRRKSLLYTDHELCVGSTDVARPAVEELYTEIMIKHLPSRFPTMFSIERGIFLNHTTGSKYSLDVKCLDEKYMLNTLAENVEEDFYFMCPDANGDFRLQAFSSCFPQGLNSPSKMGLSVREIHQPVPGYENRLGNGVDRHFRRLMPGDFVGRLNVDIPAPSGEQIRGPFTNILHHYSGVSKPTVTSSSNRLSRTPVLTPFPLSILRSLYNESPSILVKPTLDMSITP